MRSGSGPRMQKTIKDVLVDDFGFLFCECGSCFVVCCRFA